MSKILCIETSTKNCSVALNLDGEITCKEEFDANNYIHQERMHPLIKHLLEENNLRASDMDAFAVSLGPGSYTGLRIGVSAVKGFAFAMDKPVIALPTLYHMARGCKERHPGFKYYCPMIDARRMEVYLAKYSNSIDISMEVTAEEISSESFTSIKHETLFFGDGSEKTSEILGVPIVNDPIPGSILANFQASASDLAAVASEWFEAKKYADLAYFEPYYHKDFVAGLPKKIFQ